MCVALFGDGIGSVAFYERYVVVAVSQHRPVENDWGGYAIGPGGAFGCSGGFDDSDVGLSKVRNRRSTFKHVLVLELLYVQV